MKKAFLLFLFLLFLLIPLPSCESRPDMKSLLSFEEEDYSCTVKGSGTAAFLLRVDKKGDIFVITPIQTGERNGIFFTKKGDVFSLHCGTVRTQIENTSLCYPALLCELLSADAASLWKIAEEGESESRCYRCTGALGIYYFEGRAKTLTRVETQRETYEIDWD